MKTNKNYNGLNNDKRNKNIRCFKKQMIKLLRLVVCLWSVDRTFII